MNRQDIEDEIRRLDEKISEVQRRLPAHSVKPPIMMELFDLEDRRAGLVHMLADSDPREEKESP